MKNKHFNIVTVDGEIRNVPYLHKFKYYGHVFVLHYGFFGETKKSKYLLSISHFRTGGRIELDSYGWRLKELLKEKISSRILSFLKAIKDLPTINK